MGLLNRTEEYDYFANFLSCAKSASEAAQYLYDALRDFDSDRVSIHSQNMHTIENAADMRRHTMMNHLAHEFMTPIDREDVSALSQSLDTIVDSVEDVMRRIYMFNVTSLRPEAIEFSRLIVRCCNTFENVVAEFRNFKKSKKIHQFIIEVNTLESEGDKLHADSIRRLFAEPNTPDIQLVWVNIFETLESCLDACESAVGIIENVIVKNT